MIQSILNDSGQVPQVELFGSTGQSLWSVPPSATDGVDDYPSEPPEVVDSAGVAFWIEYSDIATSSASYTLVANDQGTQLWSIPVSPSPIWEAHQWLRWAPMGCSS